MKKIILTSIIIISFAVVRASYLLIPMDMAQTNHLKAYGIAYFAVEKQIDISWLLNYRGGSFMCPYQSVIENECVVRGVSYEVIADVQATQILNEIATVENNMNEIRLTKEPKIAVYSPKTNFRGMMPLLWCSPMPKYHIQLFMMKRS